MTLALQIESLRAALKAIENGPPRNLLSRAFHEAEDRGIKVSHCDVSSILDTAPEDDVFLNDLGMQVHRWDVESSGAGWTAGTSPSSPDRRAHIAIQLGLPPDAAAILARRRPIFVDGTVVITGPWRRWYTPQRSGERAFYWPHYRDFLRKTKRWSHASISSLDLATTQVVERLAEPTRVEAYQSKGLVVGFVQSGKTANFTGVAAKAIDAGYRLIIIMTGTIEMLRAQTQRRIDMEMVGRQNIVSDYSPDEARDAGVDYQDDEDWIEGRFADHGSTELATEIRRLTHHQRDYQKQFRTLKIERVAPGKPLFDPANLYRAPAQLAVVKKNATVLRKLVRDIRANSNAFAEIPVLIIDDESDQASVNTVDPDKVRRDVSDGKEVRVRRAINELIAAMLELMPRAQYVGYTATPFANVFVDPADEQGIFPKDFVVGLDRPDGYMGADDFRDSTDLPANAQSMSNREAFVRPLEATDEDSDRQKAELCRAIDVFILTGAVKLYRQSVEPGLRFRHHTMLVHQSVRRGDHAAMAELIRALWIKADLSKSAAKTRLRSTYLSEILPVCQEMLEGGVPAAPSFDNLAAYIPKAIARITEHNNDPVIVVNSDNDIQDNQQALDFDRHETWRILVGGAKLSRGFTVEGLTVTYFRRATDMSDSLTQMGRWFGFRYGYRDLVRLYIARHARFGRRTVDLYEAFESIAIDEQAFRAQLKRYAEWVGDSPRITPLQIPPLVQQHLYWLRPTAKNKMFNAELVRESEQPFSPAGYPTTPGDLQLNMELWRPLLSSAAQAVILPVGDSGGSFEAFVGLVDAEKLLRVIEGMSYLEGYVDAVVRPRVEFFRHLARESLLQTFSVMLPQPSSGAAAITGVGKRSVIARSRRESRGGKFGEITDPKHRFAAESFVRGAPVPALRSIHSNTAGAVLVYLVREDPSSERAEVSESKLVVAFSMYAPASALRPADLVPQFRVRDKGRRDAATIDAD
jgi:hypothetical protein